jgi:hypothetical protein
MNKDKLKDNLIEHLSEMVVLITMKYKFNTKFIEGIPIDNKIKEVDQLILLLRKQLIK